MVWTKGVWTVGSLLECSQSGLGCGCLDGAQTEFRMLGPGVARTVGVEAETQGWLGVQVVGVRVAQATASTWGVWLFRNTGVFGAWHRRTAAGCR